MMRRRIWWWSIAVGTALGIAALAIMWQSEIPAVDTGKRAFDPSAQARGARVVALGDCIVCHTSAGGRPYAGGLALKTPFGAIYSTNITPDDATGIGRWSPQAFTRALRHGVSRDGHLLYPAFPYVHYTRMTDEDISDAYAFLMTRTPVNAPPHANGLPFLFRFRPSLAFWNLLYLRPGPRPANDSLARGRYLVDGLGHCSSCHTPLDPIGGEHKSHEFHGAVVDGWTAPSLKALNNANPPWTEQQLVDYLATGVASEHGAAAGPMRPVVENLAKVPVEDVRAIAAYLRSVQEITSPPRASEPRRVESAQFKRGKVTFDGACGSCHLPSAPMMTTLDRPSLEHATSLAAADPRNALQTILGGIDWPAEPGRTVYMPAFGDVLSDDELVDLLIYLRANYSTKPAWPDLKSKVVGIRKLRSSP